MKQDKVFLGPICKRGHDHDGHNHSYRYISNPGSCVECKRIQSKQWSQENSEVFKSHTKRWNNSNKSHHANWKKSYRKSNWLKCLAIGVKCRHTKNGYAGICDIDEAFLSEMWDRQNGKCYWLGVAMKASEKPRHPLKATLDRLDPNKGYVKDNVVWASGLANMGRRDTPATEFGEIIGLVRSSLMEHSISGYKG